VTPPLVLVVGLQKSGTSLMLRLLTRLDGFSNPVRREGKEYWGDDPPFSPEAYPAGELYQRAGGARGHELGADDATPEIAEHLRAELESIAGDADALVMKNPYNTVRVPWLRAVFPDAQIVAITRRPLPNVFSLLKKHVENPHAVRAPEEGWWGVKPAGWRELMSDDHVETAAQQWERVYRRLWDDREMVDRIIPYQELCAEPERIVGEIAEQATGGRPPLDIPPLEALDDEYERGGPLESANRVFKRTESFEMEGAERGDEMLDPLKPEQRETIERICGPLADEMNLGLG
jgi:Sulfotransferase family